MEIPNMMQTLIDNLRSCPQEPRRFRSSLSTSNIPARRKSDVASKNTCENTCLYKNRGTGRPYPKTRRLAQKPIKTAAGTMQAVIDAFSKNPFPFVLLNKSKTLRLFSGLGGKIFAYLEGDISWGTRVCKVMSIRAR
jgi:hypothetical protein